MWNRIKKVPVIAMVGIILLGALGSGLWDITRPTITWIGLKLLTLFTLGLESIQNNTYRDIAKGHHEFPSLFLLALIMTLFALGPLAFYAYRFFILRRLDQLIDRDDTGHRITFARVLKVNIILSALIGIIFFIQLLLINYENSAITHFEQSLAIVAPYMNTDKEELLVARFAQIRNKDDYVTIIRELEQVGDSNNVNLPHFTLW